LSEERHEHYTHTTEHAEQHDLMFTFVNLITSHNFRGLVFYLKQKHKASEYTHFPDATFPVFQPSKMGGIR